MPRLSNPRDGDPVRNQPNGIPLFFEQRTPRVVTADPWAFYTHIAREYLVKPELARANAYIDQAFDFFQAAENPQIGSKSCLGI